MSIADHPEEIPGFCAEIAFPGKAHRALACETAVALARDARVTAICLICSIARGMAGRDADGVNVQEAAWRRPARSNSSRMISLNPGSTIPPSNVSASRSTCTSVGLV